MDKKNNRRPSGKLSLGGILLRAALILLCLIMLSIHLMGSLYAKYSSHGSGSDAARVAKFDVKVTGNAANDVKITYDATEADAFAFTVQNLSEVAVRYDVIVAYTPGLKGLYSVLDGTVNGTTVGNTTTFNSAGVLPVYTGADNQNSHALSLHIDWSKWEDSDWNAFTQGQIGETASANVAYTVTIHVVQVD